MDIARECERKRNKLSRFADYALVPISMALFLFFIFCKVGG